MYNAPVVNSLVVVLGYSGEHAGLLMKCLHTVGGCIHPVHYHTDVEKQVYELYNLCYLNIYFC